MTVVVPIRTRRSLSRHGPVGLVRLIAAKVAGKHPAVDRIAVLDPTVPGSSPAVRVFLHGYPDEPLDLSALAAGIVECDRLNPDRG